MASDVTRTRVRRRAGVRPVPRGRRPDYESSLEYVEALDRGGADVIELGLPFSEPIAEGPTIQNAVVRSLEGGMTPTRFFEFVEDLDVSVPLVCMTYYNLIYRYGDESEAQRASNTSGETASNGPRPFVEKAAAVGIEGSSSRTCRRGSRPAPDGLRRVRPRPGVHCRTNDEG